MCSKKLAEEVYRIQYGIHSVELVLELRYSATSRSHLLHAKSADARKLRNARNNAIRMDRDVWAYQLDYSESSWQIIGRDDVHPNNYLRTSETKLIGRRYSNGFHRRGAIHQLLMRTLPSCGWDGARLLTYNGSIYFSAPRQVTSGSSQAPLAAPSPRTFFNAMVIPAKSSTWTASSTCVALVVENRTMALMAL
jgi:hypothetical protein